MIPSSFTAIFSFFDFQDIGIKKNSCRKILCHNIKYLLFTNFLTSLYIYRYHTLYSTIINSGLHNSSGSLGFLQGILQLLEQNASFVENSEMLWRFWSAVVQPLQEHITKVSDDFHTLGMPDLLRINSEKP